MRPRFPPSLRRQSSIAIRSRSRSAPRAPPPCWHARSKPSLRRCCRPIWERSPAALGICEKPLLEPSPIRTCAIASGIGSSAVPSAARSEADRILAAELAGQHRSAQSPAAGRVTLIGCGPGDPDLLTLRAVQRLQEADVLVVDRLVDAKVLEYARRDAERILVGKS